MSKAVLLLLLCLGGAHFYREYRAATPRWRVLSAADGSYSASVPGDVERLQLEDGWECSRSHGGAGVFVVCQRPVSGAGLPPPARMAAALGYGSAERTLTLSEEQVAGFSGQATVAGGRNGRILQMKLFTAIKQDYIVAAGTEGMIGSGKTRSAKLQPLVDRFFSSLEVIN